MALRVRLPKPINLKTLPKLSFPPIRFFSSSPGIPVTIVTAPKTRSQRITEAGSKLLISLASATGFITAYLYDEPEPHFTCDLTTPHLSFKVQNFGPRVLCVRALRFSVQDDVAESLHHLLLTRSLSGSSHDSEAFDQLLHHHVRRLLRTLSPKGALDDDEVVVPPPKSYHHLRRLVDRDEKFAWFKDYLKENEEFREYWRRSLIVEEGRHFKVQKDGGENEVFTTSSDQFNDQIIDVIRSEKLTISLTYHTKLGRFFSKLGFSNDLADEYLSTTEVHVIPSVKRRRNKAWVTEHKANFEAKTNPTP